MNTQAAVENGPRIASALPLARMLRDFMTGSVSTSCERNSRSCWKYWPLATEVLGSVEDGGGRVDCFRRCAEKENEAM